MNPLLIFLLACLLVFLGTVDAAFSALMRLSLRLLAERNGRAEALRPYLEEPARFYVPSRLLTGATVVLIAVLLAGVIRLDTPQQVLGVVASTAGILLACAVVLPQVIVQRDPERVLDLVLPSFGTLARTVHPVTAAVLHLAALRRERAVAVPTSDVEEEQGEAAEAYFEAGEQEGLIETDERRLIQSIVEFGDTLVREVMTPRPDIVAISAEATVADLKALLREQTYSRIPVYKESLDNILGFVFVKDLLQQAADDSRPLTTLVRPAYVVPETKRVSELLREFQRQQVQVALVVDEYGGTAGLVALEDLIEEIVGEIRDEYDEESEPVTDEGAGVFVFSGKVDIDEVGDRLGVDIEREGFETLGGYVLSNLGRVPAVGEKFEIDGLSIEVLEAERRRVHKVRISRRQPVVQEGS
ncbi:MAG: HlyC/CorC family transporter [Acidobacteria bacterium]|nr:MAG: HlyC/CorC family transporter [Acidobacteriota bacterium]